MSLRTFKRRPCVTLLSGKQSVTLSRGGARTERRSLDWRLAEGSSRQRSAFLSCCFRRPRHAELPSKAAAPAVAGPQGRSPNAAHQVFPFRTMESLMLSYVLIKSPQRLRNIWAFNLPFGGFCNFVLSWAFEARLIGTDTW